MHGLKEVSQKLRAELIVSWYYDIKYCILRLLIITQLSVLLGWEGQKLGQVLSRVRLCKGQRCQSSPASLIDYDSPVSGEQCEWTVILDASQCMSRPVCASHWVKKNRVLKLLSVLFNHSQLISASVIHISWHQQHWHCFWTIAKSTINIGSRCILQSRNPHTCLMNMLNTSLSKSFRLFAYDLDKM